MGGFCILTNRHVDCVEEHMKYFRKHPDLLIIANYPTITARVRKSRQTTSEELSTLVVRTILSTLKNSKKILLLTDEPEETSRAGFITITAWNRQKPFFLSELVYRLIYNFQTKPVFILYHAELFGAYSTILIMPILLALLLLSGKRTVLAFLTMPTLSTRPTIAKAILYILRVTYRRILSLLSTVVIEPKPIRTYKERHIAGKLFVEELFPSPVRDLGLQHTVTRTK